MDEKKEYSLIGTVTIGTDEYRDLIERALKAEASSSDYRSKYWAEQTKVNELNKQVETLQVKIAKCEKFIKTNISEDSIKLFVNMFGEE